MPTHEQLLAEYKQISTHQRRLRVQTEELRKDYTRGWERKAQIVQELFAAILGGKER